MSSNYYKLLKSEIIITFKNNIFLIILATAIFIGSMCVGYIFSGFLDSILTPAVSTFKERVATGEIKIETFSIFKNNLNVITIMYLGGIIFGILPAILLLYNGLFIGYFASLSTSLNKFLILTLPHGIFEIPAIILAATGSFVIVKFIIFFINAFVSYKQDRDNIDNNITNNIHIDNIKFFPDLTIKQRLDMGFKDNAELILQSLIFFGMAILLMFISAVIEANLTIPIAG